MRNDRIPHNSTFALSLFQLQHEHLLEVLDSTATASLPQTVTEEEVEEVEEGGGEAQMEELQPTHHHSPNSVILQAGAVADIQTETEDSMAPVRWCSSILIYRFYILFSMSPCSC